MEAFANFPALIEIVKQGKDNGGIFEATKTIKELEQIPGYTEYVINYLVNTQDQYHVMFSAVSIMGQIRSYWENENLYSNKSEIRNKLLQIMVNSQGGTLKTISKAISVIASIDFPDKWPDLMLNLTSALNTNQFSVIHAVLYTSSEIFKRYERQTSSESLFREINLAVNYWGPKTAELLTETLVQFPQCQELFDCFEYTLSIIHSLCALDLPEYYLQNMDKFFLCYHNFLTMPPNECLDNMQIMICMILKQHIIRYITEISKWGRGEEDQKTEEEIAQFNQLWIQLLHDLLGLTKPNGSRVVIAIFDALTALSRSNFRNFFIESQNLEKLCTHILIPCIALGPEDEENFMYDSLNYFLHDIEGLDSESKRMSAYNFLKVLGRYFRPQLLNVFMSEYSTLLASYNQDPANNWRSMDTAIFVVSIIAAKLNLINVGVTELIPDFDLTDFLSKFIIPLIGGTTYPLLQADAIKFIVDFRNVTDPAILVAIFPQVASLLFRNDSPVALYAAYFIDRILLTKSFSAASPQSPAANIGGNVANNIVVQPEILLQNIDVASLVNKLFEIFKWTNELNLIAPRCLMRLVVQCGGALVNQIGGIVQTCVNYLISLTENPTNPSFNHCLFEVIVGAVTRVGVPVPSIEEPVFRLLNVILTHEVAEFIPYVFQIIGCFLLSYPEGVAMNQFYTEQFGFFLQVNHWMASGNVPALAILIRAYCIKLPQLILANIEPLLGICQSLLQGTRSHPHAFVIFVSILRFIAPEYVLPLLPKIYELVFGQLQNQALKKYRQSFAIFMADACFFLGPDNALRPVLQQIDQIMPAWAEALPSVRGRAQLESAIAGCMGTLLACSIIGQETWEQLFVGTVKMLEAPSNDIINDEIEVLRQEEQDAKQFDTTFSKLVYSELPLMNPHPELAKINLVGFMAEKFSEYSHAHPGYLADVVSRRLEPYLQNSFASYTKTFNLQFS